MCQVGQQNSVLVVLIIFKNYFGCVSWKSKKELLTEGKIRDNAVHVTEHCVIKVGKMEAFMLFSGSLHSGCL
jgi:hypothetical protein